MRLHLPERRRLRLALESLLVATASLVLATIVLGLWSGQRLAETFSRGDIVFHAALVRSIQLTGWYSGGPGLGAPNGQDMADFPLGGDHLHLVGLRLLAVLPISAVSIVNLYYLISFGLVAGVTHLTLRSLGSDAVPAGAAAILFAFQPYHFAHGAQHLFLSMYPAVPLAILLAAWIGDGRLSWHVARWRWAVAGACILVVGCASAYYAVFGAISIVTGAAFGAIRGRRLRPLLVGVTAAAAVAVVLVANLTPTLLHRRAEGQNIEVAHRSRLDSELYGLRPAALVVPDPTHRIGSFARRGQDLDAVPSPGELGSYVGFVGVLGLLGLLGSCLAGLADVRIAPGLGLLAAMLLAMLAVGARGGGGFALALAGFTDIRAWGRTSLVIALLALGAAALLATATATARRVGVVTVTAATAVLLVLGLLDQIPRQGTPDRAAVALAVRSERALVADMERDLPAGAMVYQLPYLRFPEAGPYEDMVDYDQLRPYVLGGGRLRWSFGGLRGRGADWQELWAAEPAPVLLRAVAAAGFSALWVDRRGYADQAEALLGEVGAVTGLSPRSSEDGHLAWYDLRPFVASTRADLGAAADDVGRAVASVPRAVWAQGFGPISGPPPGPRLVTDGAALALRPSRGSGQSAVLLLSVDVPAGVTITVEVGQTAWRSSGPGLQHGRLAVELGGGPTQVRFRFAGARQVGFSTIAPVDAAALALLPVADSAAALP